MQRLGIADRARSFSELLSRPQSERIVLRAGRPIATAPPDPRELGLLFRPGACA